MTEKKKKKKKKKYISQNNNSVTTSSNLNIYNILLTISSELLNIKTKLKNIICSKSKTSKVSFAFLLELTV